MSIRQQIKDVYKDVFENKDVLFKVMPNGVIVREKELFLDNEGKPFQFDNRFEIITYAKATDWTAVFEDSGNVNVEFAFAYSSTTKQIDNFVYEARLNGLTIDSININTADIMQRYFFRRATDDKYPINYKALLIKATMTNIKIQDFLCESY